MDLIIKTQIIIDTHDIQRFKDRGPVGAFVHGAGDGPHRIQLPQRMAKTSGDPLSLLGQMEVFLVAERPEEHGRPVPVPLY